MHATANSNRFDCGAREYKYFIVQDGALDVGAMRDAAARLVGDHDFRNFCKPDVAQASGSRRWFCFAACARPAQGEGARGAQRWQDWYAAPPLPAPHPALLDTRSQHTIPCPHTPQPTAGTCPRTLPGHMPAQPRPQHTTHWAHPTDTLPASLPPTPTPCQRHPPTPATGQELPADGAVC